MTLKKFRALCFGLAFVSLAASASASKSRKPASTSRRPQMKISELMRQLEASGQLGTLETLVKARLAQLVPQPELRARLEAAWEEARRKKDFAALDRFPVVPLRHVGRLRTAFGGLETPREQRPEPAVVKGALEDILGECRELAPLPRAVSPKLPMLTDGHFPDSGLGLCEQDRSLKLARVLNALAAANGSEVLVEGARVRSAEKLVEALIRSGHKVEMRDERTYANFLSINWGDQPVIWPVWVDSGLKTSEGEPIVTPVGHSHHAWRIEGPLVSARLSFFLGVSGVGFFAQVDERPAWTGLRATWRLGSAEGETTILKTLDYASRYAHRIRKEARAHASDLPADGYGFVGVCNDSNAVLEHFNRGTLTVYPLMRAAELDEKSRLSDGLETALRRLPKDSVDFARTPENLARVLAMTPFESLDDRDLHDETLRRTLKSLERELGRGP